MELMMDVALLSGLALANKHSIPKRAEEPLYYRGKCENNIVTVGSLLVATEYDEVKTTSACNRLGGKLCNNGCVITGDKEMDDLTHACWKEACATAGADDDDLFGRDYLTKEDIEDYAGC